MRRRWWLPITAGAVLAAIVLVPVTYIEMGCRAPLPGVSIAHPPPLLPPVDRRPLANSFLTYPEWYIVYEAEAYARHLSAGRPPSGFDYGRQVGGFWRGYCAVNRLTRGAPGAGEGKLTIYTIGISYTIELALKAGWERTIGRLSEAAGGWDSADDRHAASVQRRYGAFLHETPWYRFPFAGALAAEWRTRAPRLGMRHWERRLALTGEFGIKALYAKAIDAVTGATVGRDELQLRFVTAASPAAIHAVDPRLVPVGRLPGGLTIVEAPRYQAFNDLLGKLAADGIAPVEIAGNRTILATLLLPAGVRPPVPPLFTTAFDRPGWSRVGVAVPVAALPALYRTARTAGGTVEHVYDY